MSGIRRNFVLLLLFSLLVYALWMFYYPLVNGFFLSDDISWIWFSATKSFCQIFFSPEDYRAISSSNFTPLLGVSFKADWLLFGMEPKGYLAHNMISVLLTGTVLFIFIRLYTSNLTAFVGLILFLLNPITLSVFSWSSTRHYIEGMFFALLSLLFALRAEKKGRIFIACGIFYLLSSLCKEVYVLLPFVVVTFIFRGNVFQRIKKSTPMIIALIAYLIWRFYMLGGIGGYPFADSSEIEGFTDRISKTIKLLSYHLFGAYGFLLFAFVVLIFITVKSKAVFYKSALVFLILLMPVLSVSGLMGVHFSWARYFLHLSLFLLCLSVLWGRESYSNSWRRKIVYVVFITVVTVFLIRDSRLTPAIQRQMQISETSANEFIRSGKMYIQGKQDAWFYDGLRDLYEYFFNKKIHTMIIPSVELHKYISDTRRIDILSHGHELKEKDTNMIDERGISGKIQVKGFKVKWDFTPRENGVYRIIRGRYRGLYNYSTFIPPKGEYEFGRYYPDGRPEVYYLRVIYYSHDGMESVTGEYRIEIPGNSLITIGNP